MTAKHDADLAWLKLLLERLEELRLTLRPHAAGRGGGEDVGRKKPRRARRKSSRSRRFEALRGLVVQKAIDLGRELFDPTDEARHDDERCLQRYAETMELSPQARDVFRLNRTEGMEHDEIASYLNVNMSAVQDQLLAIMLAVLKVEESLDNDGVAKKGS